MTTILAIVCWLMGSVPPYYSLVIKHLGLVTNKNVRQVSTWKDIVASYTPCAWAGGTFFPVVLLCQFWFWREIGSSFTYSRIVLKVQYNCGIVLVFWFWREIFFGVTYVLSVQYSCVVVSVFWLWWEIVLKMRTPFDFLWAVSTKKSYWVTLFWSASQCVYFIRPNTLLMCIFLFCIFLLYHTDPQVEVQTRILLKDKYVKLSQTANTGNHTLIFWTMLIGFLYFREITC